jgi:hypothetical protein
MPREPSVQVSGRGRSGGIRAVGFRARASTERKEEGSGERERESRMWKGRWHARREIGPSRQNKRTLTRQGSPKENKTKHEENPDP